MEEKMLFQIENPQVTLEVYEEYCKLKFKRTFWSFVFTRKFFSGEKTIYYRDLTAVQFCDACEPFSGYLKFEYAGAPNTVTFSNLLTDSAMTFRSEHSELMKNAYAFIDSVVKKQKTGVDMGIDAQTACQTHERIITEIREAEERRLAEEEARRLAEENEAGEIRLSGESEDLNEKVVVVKSKAKEAKPEEPTSVEEKAEETPAETLEEVVEPAVDTKICSGCGHVHQNGEKFCAKCGTAL